MLLLSSQDSTNVCFGIALSKRVHTDGIFTVRVTECNVFPAPVYSVADLIQHLQKGIEPVRLFCQNIVNGSTQQFTMGRFLLISQPLVVGDTLIFGICNDG